MATLQIDNRPVTVPVGSTVLDAARALGIDVPSLCHHSGCSPNTSCLCCVVKINGSPRMVPSCATKAVEGMSVQSETPEIHSARKMALELLLADHAGDCRAPCQNVCPAKMDIPTMLRLIHEDRLHDALVTVKQHIALPAALGRVCPALCEKGCRRGQIDAAVSICQLKRYVADADLASANPWLPPCDMPSGKRVAIVGAGPAGLAAAWYLLQLGHACMILDAMDEPGGNLRYAIDPEILPHDVLAAEIDLVRRLGARFTLKTRIGKDVTLAELRQHHDAVLIAIGEIDAAKAATIGLPTAGKGLKVDKTTMLTPSPGVFATGAAVTPYRHAVRACGDGRTAAQKIDAFLHGEAAAAPRSFAIRLGVLSEAELAVFQVGAGSDTRAARAGPGGLSDHQANIESGRCLHCECGKLNPCMLRRYASAYDADSSAYKIARRPFTRQIVAGDLVFEEGKCISCGLCVSITQREKEALGLTFIGRGFDVRVGVPLDRSLADALKKTAEECVRVCPTGALASRSDPACHCCPET
jgi:ferredoxin